MQEQANMDLGALSFAPRRRGNRTGVNIFADEPAEEQPAEEELAVPDDHVCRGCDTFKPGADFVSALGSILPSCVTCHAAKLERLEAERKAKKDALEAAKKAGGTKKCICCGETKALKSFNQGRNNCTSCRNKQAKERSEKKAAANPDEYKMCLGCGVSHPIRDFDDGMETCRRKSASGARNDSRPERTARKTELQRARRHTGRATGSKE